jgi:KaiC/GvpD/RAD55 family RecA-like ATPase
MSSSLEQELRRLELGAHLCLIYENRKQQLTAVLPFIKHGLESQQKCLYIADEHTVSQVGEALASFGMEVSALCALGQLNILTSRETYCQEGYFDPDRMIALLREATDTALQEGYAGLRITGEMT